MRHRHLARFDLERGDPGVFGEAARNQERHPLDDIVRRAGWYAEFRSTDDDVGLDLPTVRGPIDRRRRVLGIAFERAGIRPLGNRFDVACRERPIVGELAVRRIGKPWRHLAAFDFGLHRPRPRSRLAERHERHRCHLSGPMTRLTVLLEDGQNVFVEGDGSALRRCLRVASDRSGREDQERRTTVAEHSPSPERRLRIPRFGRQTRVFDRDAHREVIQALPALV
jgi:hypothetical protein